MELEWAVNAVNATCRAPVGQPNKWTPILSLEWSVTGADIYREGKGPAGVHGFYMYTWAAHGMDKARQSHILTYVRAIHIRHNGTGARFEKS